MKKLIKKMTPEILKPLLYNEFMFKIFRRKYRNTIKDKSTEDVFNYIHTNNVWGDRESVSGSGSNSNQTQKVVSLISNILKKLEVKTFLDVPCGDFHWMQKVELGNISYIGGDIVENIIDENNKNYKSEKISFKVLNLISDELPECDLLLCRDCFVHLSNNNVLEAMKNIKKQNRSYNSIYNKLQKIK